MFVTAERTGLGDIETFARPFVPFNRGRGIYCRETPIAKIHTMDIPSEPRLRTVIVDDEERSRNTLQSLLATYCPEVAVLAQADSADSAEQLLATERPDVLFLDIQMPGGSGFELLERIRDRDFPVVFVTAHDKYAIRAIRASAIDYLLKPLDIDELRETVRKLVRLRKERFASPPSPKSTAKVCARSSGAFAKIRSRPELSSRRATAASWRN